ncbi:hypothetical protein CFP56_023741 [Quercus suber]|uniref:Uncharacterized protein n=1 Tax=Quercus suber TaxID=58331 RepID=A0AAW0LY72_QUESU
MTLLHNMTMKNLSQFDSQEGSAGFKNGCKDLVIREAIIEKINRSSWINIQGCDFACKNKCSMGMKWRESERGRAQQPPPPPSHHLELCWTPTLHSPFSSPPPPIALKFEIDCLREDESMELGLGLRFGGLANSALRSFRIARYGPAKSHPLPFRHVSSPSNLSRPLSGPDSSTRTLIIDLQS